MKKVIKVITIVLAVTLFLFAILRLIKSDLFITSTRWVKTYDIDNSFIAANLDDGYGIVQTPDGGYIVSGITTGEQNGTFLVMRLTSKGSVIWAKQFGKFDGNPTSLIKTSDNCYLIAGDTYSRKSDRNLFLVKIDIDGNIKWSKSYGRIKTDWFDFAGLDESKVTADVLVDSISQTSDGGFVLCGCFHWYGGPKDYMGSLDRAYSLVIKLNANGEINWVKGFKEEGTAWGLRFISQTSDGGFLTAGEIRNHDILLIKLSSDGKVEWERILDDKFPNKVAVARSFAFTKDGGAIICGDYEDRTPSGNCDILLIRVDRNGEVLWAKTYGAGKDNLGYYTNSFGHFIKQAQDGNFVVVGDGGFLDGELFILKVDENGKLIWAKKSKYGLTIYYSTCASLTTDGGFVVTGETVSPNVALLNFDVGNTDIFVAKFDKDGNLGGNCESSSNFRTILKDYSPIISSVEFIQMSFIPFHTMQHLKLSRFLHSLQKYGMLR